MPSKVLCLLWLAAALNATGAVAQDEVAPTPPARKLAPTPGAAPAVTAAPAPGGIRISIKNEYDAKINFGPLGKGWRKGTDMAEGVLKRQGSEYVGIITASVESDQLVASFLGPASDCPGHYEDLQLLKATGHRVGGFNQQVQTVTQITAIAAQATEYLRLEFAPVTVLSQQDGYLRLPEDMLPDLNVSCHTLIDTLSGIAFLPLNDTRWTMEGGGYIIALPSTGALNYTDETVPTAGGERLGPFNAKKSVWTIRVERLP